MIYIALALIAWLFIAWAVAIVCINYSSLLNGHIQAP